VRDLKSKGNHSGFSLVELIAVMVILGVMVLTVIPKFTTFNADLQASRDDIIAALFFAQQVAMARDSSTNAIQFVSTANSVSVTENGVALINGGTQYPVTLPAGSDLTAVTLNYDKLGRIGSATTLTLSGVNNIQISESGYAR
jgi:MSHA pilin protein MshC